MIVKKTVGSIIQSSTVHIAEKGLLDIFIPKTTVSNRWKTWKATIDFKTCMDCLNNHGKVYRMEEYIPQEPPLHTFCRCVIEAMKAVERSEATRDGENGADYILFAQGILPDYYISRAEAIALGWKSSKPLAKYAPGKMLFGGIYLNEDGLLLSAPGRIWYEADINYYSGRRNSHRILFSNDGLVFVSYDHCRTFYEII